MSASGGTVYNVFVGVTPGLESLLDDELRQLLGAAATPKRLIGGCELTLDAHGLWCLARHARLAESLRVRLGKRFRAVSFKQFNDGLRRLPWAAFLRRGTDAPNPVVKVVCSKSRLYHSDAIAERTQHVVSKLLGLQRRPGDQQAGGPTLHVRIVKDHVQVSLDAAGERLHRRGYRRHVARASLRETLAAACLRAAGYNGERSVWDPFCGAGTFVIEAASVAQGRPAPVGRRFAFEDWPTHDREAYARFCDAELQPAAQPRSVQVGSDADPGAVAAARVNATAAGLDPQPRFICADFAEAAVDLPDDALVICNPPYGKRLDGRELVSVYGRLGAFVAQRPWAVYMLTGFRDAESATGLSWQNVVSFSNRGLPVRLLRRA